METGVAAHVILVQQPIDGFRSTLLTTLDSAFIGDQVDRAASMIPDPVQYNTLVGMAFRDIDCQDPANACTAWVGDDELLPHDRLPVIDGHSLVVSIHRHVRLGPNDEDHWYTQSPAVTDATDGIQYQRPEDSCPIQLPATHPSRVKRAEQASSRAKISIPRVPVFLDPCIDWNSTATASFNENDSTLLWFLHDNWKAVVAESLCNSFVQVPPECTLPDPTLHAITNCMQMQHIGDFQCFELYLDGATTSISSGWAMVLVAKHSLGDRLLGVTGGTVCLSPDDPQWVGAISHDNIASELTAMLAAHAVVLQSDTNKPFCIRPDLSLSRLISEQLSTTVAHPVLAQLCRVAAGWNAHRHTIVEVRGHTGNPWNELADTVAKFCALNDHEGVLGFHFGDLHRLACQSHDVAWEWLKFQEPSFEKCLPPVFDGTVFQFPAFRPPEFDCIPDQIAQPHPLKLDLRLASVNVLALDHINEQRTVGRQHGTRTARIDSQFHSAKVHILGIQEARTMAGRFQSDNYTILASGCQGPNAARLGVELWLHKSLPITHDQQGSPLLLSQAHVSVQHADVRRLVARLDFGSLCIQLVVLHAPCLQKSQGDGNLPIDLIREWWKETADILSRQPPAVLSWTMVDANASLATEACEFFGLHGATRTTQQTECFEDFLREMHLYVPSTFADIHVGPNHTWSHSSGRQHRIDFILANKTAFHMSKSTRVMLDYDGSFAHDDHLPVILDVLGWQAFQPDKARIRWDESALLDPQRCTAFQNALASLPMPTWDVHPNDHCRIYESQLLALARQFFEKRKQGRRRPTLSAHTMQSVAMKRHILDCGRCFGLMQDPTFKAQLKDIEATVRKLVRQDMSVFYDQLLVQMQMAGQASDFKAMYSVLTRIGGKRYKRNGQPLALPMVKNKSGVPATSFSEQQNIWLEQFAAIEAGICMDPEEMTQQSVLPAIPLDVQQPEAFPTEWQVQAAVSKLKRGKAPGPNLVTPSILKAAGSTFAKQFVVLMMKAASHASEPTGWRGGILVPLHKGKGPADEPMSYRSIFVSDFTGKIYHRAIRAQLERIWEAKIESLQLGSRKGMGADLAHHLLEAHQATFHFLKVPNAIVFFDLRAAFYSVLRQSLMDLPQDSTALIHALRRLEVPDHEIREWLLATSEDNAIEGATPHLQHLVRDTVSHTFFRVSSLQDVCCTTRGTRPGDPLGDLLFNMIMRLIMRDCRTRITSTTPCVWMGSPAHCTTFASAEALPPAAFLDLAFVDDAAIALHAPSLEQLEHVIQQAATSMFLAATRRGMHLNFEKGKTEVLWHIVGRGSRTLKQRIHEQTEALRWEAEGHEFHLGVTQSYKHLGTWLQAPPRHARDIHHRASLAKASWGSLSRPLHSKSYVSMSTKTKAFQSLSMSRLLYNAHTWGSASPEDWNRWQNHMRKPIGLMVKHSLQGVPPTHLETVDLYGIADLLPPVDQLQLARLRYLKRLISYCPQALWTLLHHGRDAPHSWLQACAVACQWFHQFYPYPFGPEDPSSLESWIPYIAMDLKWKGRLKNAAKACLRFRRATAEYHIWQKRFDEQFLVCGGRMPQQQTSQSETWTCDVCSKTFASKRALASHAGRVHGYRRVVKYFAFDETCNACGKFYHCRKRLIEHLKDVPHCLETMQACMPALTDEQVTERDLHDHQHTLRMREAGWWSTKALAPVQKIHGPLLPIPGSAGAAEMLARWTLRTQAPGTAFQNLQGRRADHNEQEPDVILFQDDMPAFLFQSQHGPNAGDGRYALNGLAREHARLHIKTLVFVHVFSGFRRKEDLHTILEHKTWHNIHFFVISIDMCMQRVEGNLATSKAFSFWMTQIGSGQVCGMGGGPPCETFTAARLLEGSPPPLRSGAWPLGFPNLKLRPWNQVMVGSRLIWFLTEALLRLAATGGLGFLEHPQFPLWATAKDPASIWTLRELRLLKTMECIGVTSFDQCPCGSTAIKPTTIMHLRLPALRSILLSKGHMGRCPHRKGHHEQMAGRTETGEFRTAKAKIYPAGLNAAIADAVHQRIHEDFAGVTTQSSLPEGFSSFLQTAFVADDLVQPDYHG